MADVCALWKRFDPRVSKHYLRCLPEAACSTPAMILLTLWRSSLSRGAGAREGAGAFLHSFLKPFFADEDFELQLAMGASVGLRMGDVHSDATTLVPVDRGQVFYHHFVSELDSGLHETFQVCCVNLGLELDPDSGTMPLASFLQVIYSLGQRSYTMQCVGQVASWIEAVREEKVLVANPMEIDEDEPSLPKYARHDRTLVDRLAMGQGLACESDRAWQQGSFVRTYHAVTKTGKRMRILQPKVLNEDIMLRQLQTAQAVLKDARHINLAIDGTRLGKKDVLFIAIGGYTIGKYRISWAPIQATIG